MQKKIISITLKSSWVLRKRNNKKLPVDELVECFKKDLQAEILRTSLTECEFLIVDDVSNEDVKEVIGAMIMDTFFLDSLKGVAEFTVADYTAEPEKKEETAEISKQEENSEVEKALNKINAFIGAEEFKALAEECVKVVPGLIRHDAIEAFTQQCYIFAINDGNGLTTYLKAFAELLGALGLFDCSGKIRVVEEKIPAPNPKHERDVFASVCNHFNCYSASVGKIICIDISEWMTKTTDTKFRDFLSTIEDNIGDNIVVFRVPFVEKDILKGLHKGIGDILSVREISFVPFNNEELAQSAAQSLTKRGFTIQDDAWEIFNSRITEEKNDGRFYGINTVNKVVREMIYQKQLSNAFNNTDDTEIKKSDIISMATTYVEHEQNGIEMLSEFVGMESIRERVEEIVAQIEMSAKNSNLGHPCIHMRFVGNPGTGKTTVARVIGKILKEKGILRNGNFFEYLGRDFCGRYVGETAPKTAAMCRDAYGSVLFIDEAYSLYRGAGHSTVDFGREAIDTLIAEMENHRFDLVVIMAGYPDEMKDLMTANAGLESRMPYIIEFPNYTRDQLYEIFMLMVKKNFKYKEGFEEAVKEYFTSLPDEVIEAKEFSNARFVRNLFERTWGKAVLRSQLNKEEASVLTKEDFLLSSSEKEFKKIMQKQNKALGFI